jgi:hypothetical protein
MLGMAFLESFFFIKSPLQELVTPQLSYCAFVCCACQLPLVTSCHNLGEEEEPPMVHETKIIFLVVLSSPIEGITT